MDQERARAEAELRDLVENVIPNQLNEDRVCVSADDYLMKPDFTTDKGIYVGVCDDQMIFYNGNGSMIVYGPPGTGKFRDFLAHNLAHLVNRTLICMDPKGEAYLRSVDHRKGYQGGRVLALNPGERLGIPSKRYNPIGYIAAKAQAGGDISNDVNTIVKMLFTQGLSNDEKNPRPMPVWVTAGSSTIAEIFITRSAILDPSRATLSGLWEFAVQEEGEFWSAIFEASQHPKLPRALRMKAKNFYEEYVNILGTVELDNGLLQATEIQNKSGKMQEYSGHVRSHVRDTLRIYEPGSVFDDITSETNFDVAGLLRQPGSLFLVLTEEFMTVGESWAALMFSSLMKELALIDGHVKCTWMMDEITTLPPIPNYLTNMLRLRSKGHQFVSIAHSRSALDRVYGEKDRKGIEDAAAVTLFWDQGGDVKLCEEVSRLAGEMNVPMMVPSVNNSVDSDGASFGLQIQKTPLATPGQVAGVSNGSQVVLTRSYPRVGTMSRVHYDDIAAYKAVIRPPIEMLG